MPDTVMYYYNSELISAHFADPKAMLPVKLKNGQIQLFKWGRHKIQNGELPLGGWARLTAIHHGQWDFYLPKPVKLPIVKFMEKDFEGHAHWYEVTQGCYIQGLLVREQNEVRLYIVTITPELPGACHDRWPRIIIG